MISTNCDEYPMAKIERNRARDTRASAHLTEIGWTVLRFWEHEDVATIVEKIAATVEVQRSTVI